MGLIRRGWIRRIPAPWPAKGPEGLFRREIP